MDLSKNRFSALWLCSAAIVTIARALNTADLGYDLTVQIEAAHHLLQGKGLSIYALGGEEDLAQPARLIPLSHFPCGYSLCVAALIAIGFSVAAALKTLGAAATILGWWGWSKVASALFADGLKRGWVGKWAAFVIAVATPLLFTPRWQGTDIILWAAVPWVLSWMVKASTENRSGARWLDGLAGAVCGLCVLMRYASVFLAMYAGVLILCYSRNHLKVLLQRCSIFAAGLLPPLAFQFYLNHGGRPASLFLGQASTEFERLCDALLLLPSANYPFVWWMPEKVRALLTQSGGQAPWLLGLTLVAFGLLLYLLVRNLRSGELRANSCDVRTATIGLFLALPAFLCVSMLLGNYPFVSDHRMYTPLLPAAIFVAYALAADNQDKNKIERLIRLAGLCYVTAYLGMAVARVALFVLPIEEASNQYTKLLGTSDVRHWPSMKIAYEYSTARSYVLNLLKEQPDTVLLTDHEEWFYAQPDIDHSRLRRCMTLRATHVSGPAHILIVAGDSPGGPVDGIDCFTNDGKPLPANYLEHLPTPRLVRRFPDETIKIVEANVPAGMHITLRDTEQPRR